MVGIMRKENTFFDWRFFFIAIIVTSIIANIIAVITLHFSYPLMRTLEVQKVISESSKGDDFIYCMSFALPTMISFFYIIPILKASKIAKIPIAATAKRRLINTPLVVSSIGVLGWIIGIFGLIFGMYNNNIPFDIKVIFRFSSDMMIWALLVFGISYYMLEAMNRRFFLPSFFPDGKLADVKNSIRLSVQARFNILFISITVFPCFVFYQIILASENRIYEGDIAEYVSYLLIAMLITSFLLTVLLAKSYQNALEKMADATDKIKQNDFDFTIKVTSNDEVGILGDSLNSMGDALRDRFQMKQTMALARDVQQNLLPQKAPNIEGLDIAGHIVYSDETGGDYYDYIYSTDSNRIAIVIGDVSEHGIPSAILMATTRAFIRQRAALKHRISTLVTDVNYQFSRDVEDSGHFMTLFYLSIDLEKERLEWVRAGHEPALLFDPGSNRFEELEGMGVALGINGDYSYQENEKLGFGNGQILVLGTDGLWETSNTSEEMYGKDRFREMIQRNAHKNANEIVSAILSNVKAFSASAIPEDDITLVVVKRVS